MLCGPFAVQRATGIPHETIVRFIRWWREQRGSRLSLKGGTRITELRAALRDEGWCSHRVFWRKRIHLKALVRRIKKGRWIFYQRNHFFGARSAADLKAMARRSPDAIVIDAWIIHRKEGR